MIDPKLLTKENGFVEGCVVEYTTTDNGKDVEYFDEAFRKMFLVKPEAVEWFTSIRPLTGPMAIWNFAPKGATVLVKNAGAMYWMNHIPDLISQHDEVILMPFWAKANQ